MSKILVAGLTNIETTVPVREFPIPYFPIDYPFFKVRSLVSGVGYNIAGALSTLEDDVLLASFVGKDYEGERVISELNKMGVDTTFVEAELEETPTSVVLYDTSGKREVYCDLKDIQEREYNSERLVKNLSECDIVSICNINFTRGLLREAKKMGKVVATDVHVLADIDDEYNKEFMENANILFLSNENILGSEKEFLLKLKNTYPCDVIVIGEGDQGALMYVREDDCCYQLGAVTIGKVINTIGAGDALFSCFIHFYAKGYSELECLKRAVIFASNKIGFNGASTGFICENKLELLYKSHQINIIKY